MTRNPISVDLSSADAPRPSLREMQERLATELSLSSRVSYTLLLLFDLAVAIAVGSLWLTEPGLPARTHIAFGAIVAIASVWAVVFLRTLVRRKVLLARHRIVTTRIAVLFSTIYTGAAFLLAATRPELRSGGLAAGALGVVMLAVAVLLWRRAAARYRELVERTRRLRRELATGSAA